MNTLYYGDNLEILRRYIKDESVDLIYLDPPFKSNATYNVLFEEKNGTASTAQIRAFKDTWHWDKTAEDTYLEIVEKSPKNVADLIKAFRSFLGQNDMMAYLVMMSIRLVELHRVLKKDGSIYLHCDPTASHYLKLLMDAIFGQKHFVNEIIWRKNSGGIGRTSFNKRHDTLLLYSKTSKYFYDGKAVGDLRQQNEGTFGGYFGTDKDGRKYREVRKAGKVYKYYMDEPKNPDDVWEVPQIPERDKTERLGYPTQKPEALLERAIKASSKEGDIVLDVFCGCGTSIIVAEKLKRKWIGIDITHLAISLMKHRLRDRIGRVKYKVIGEPKDIKGAEALKNEDKYQFQWWALGLVDARPSESEQKKGADRGIDGYIYFHDDIKKTDTKQIIIQVKSGHIGVKDIRDLRGVLDREQAQIGVFITLEKPTRNMTKEAVSSGYYKSPLGHKYPKLQILTIEELLDGKKIEYPSFSTGIDATFKKAPRYHSKISQALLL